MAKRKGPRWSPAVYEGLQMIYSFMSNEADVCQWCEIECTARDEDGDLCGPCGKCRECRNLADLEKGLGWLGAQIDKHHHLGREG
jgi:hypothetical protein